MTDEVMSVDDRDDPRIVAFVGMRDPVVRRDLNGFIAEGPDIVRQALVLGLEVVSALIDSRNPLAVHLPRSCEVFAATPKLIGAITGLGVHRGMLALVRRPVERTADEVLAASRCLVVLEGVENPVNVGLIARSAAGLGIDALVVDATSADPLYRRAVTASRGATLQLPWARVASVPRFLEDAAEFSTVALTLDPTAPSLRTLGLSAVERVALVVGSEGPGLIAETVKRCSLQARIPMTGLVDSLNVATAVAIACWEISPGRQ